MVALPFIGYLCVRKFGQSTGSQGSVFTSFNFHQVSLALVSALQSAARRVYRDCSRRSVSSVQLLRCAIIMQGLIFTMPFKAVHDPTSLFFFGLISAPYLIFSVSVWPSSWKTCSMYLFYLLGSSSMSLLPESLPTCSACPTSRPHLSQVPYRTSARCTLILTK